MCGRLFCIYDEQELCKISKARFIKNNEKYVKNYNITPSQYIPVIKKKMDENEHQNKINIDEDHISVDEERELIFLNWGFNIPDIAPVVNARIEELQYKKTFKGLLNKGRCVVIISGFYEWDKGKQAFAFRNNNNPLFVAGLVSKEQTVLLLTQNSKGQIENVHHRMPVVLDENMIEKWIDCEKIQYQEIINSVIQESEKNHQQIDYYKIAPHLKNTKEKGQICLQSYEDYLKEQDKIGIKKFFQTTHLQNNIVKRKSKPSDTQKSPQKHIKYQDTLKQSSVINQSLQTQDTSKVQIKVDNNLDIDDIDSIRVCTQLN